MSEAVDRCRESARVTGAADIHVVYSGVGKVYGSGALALISISTCAAANS